MPRVLLAIILPLWLFVSSQAADKTIDQILTTRYRNQVLVLRHPFALQRQEYDSDGKPLITGDLGSWTVYGRILAKKIKIESDSLQIFGERLAYRFDGRNKPLKPVRYPENTWITIHLKQPSPSEDEAVDAVSHVFALTPEEVTYTFPPLWQLYATQQKVSLTKVSRSKER